MGGTRDGICTVGHRADRADRRTRGERRGESFGELEARTGAPRVSLWFDAQMARFVQSRCSESERNVGAPWRIPESESKTDRKSTRLNSSHSQISYAVFCLKKKKKT